MAGCGIPWDSLVLVWLFPSPFLSSPSRLREAKGWVWGRKSALDLLGLSFSGMAPVPKFIAPLSFSVFQPPPSADLTRLADDTSGGHKEVSRLIGRGFCEVRDLGREWPLIFFSVAVLAFFFGCGSSSAELFMPVGPGGPVFSRGWFPLENLTCHTLSSIGALTDLLEVVSPPGPFHIQFAAFLLIHEPGLFLVP